ALINTASCKRLKADTSWSRCLVAEQSRLSAPMTQQGMSELRVQPHRSESFGLSSDPFFIEMANKVIVRFATGCLVRQ
ncbi:MAG: hypothetical protein LC121_19915, partial [Anaerolineae bacterium]|nr:hypothetical protein [Anaerolineae bacterium]